MLQCQPRQTTLLKVLSTTAVMLSYILLVVALVARSLLAAPASHSHRSHRSLHTPARPAVASLDAERTVGEEPVNVVVPRGGRDEQDVDGRVKLDSFAQPL
ncbi:hypothetical protein O9K51_00503 [Purpureocillium lavendulum]|uniref:Uncharacterized protein n=1 Tax=Purpureocillium lavendulum TaxID=1247861 RepID=A0AB34G6B7_9HYPO|nr:hypothetical protein O9K51_00503 [Purpureocillium lavendulum]